MTLAVAWCGVAIALVSLGWQITREVSDRKRRRLLGPSDETRAGLLAIRDLFQDMVTVGGGRSDFFTGDNRGAGQRIRDCVPRSGDALLRSALERVADAWDKAFAHAPARRGARFYASGGPSQAQRERDAAASQRLAQQVEVAREGLIECANAISRLNQLGD